MDNDKLWIEMCEKLKPLQEEWQERKPQTGEWVYDKGLCEQRLIIQSMPKGYLDGYRIYLVYLPSLEQMIGMMPETGFDLSYFYRIKTQKWMYESCVYQNMNKSLGFQGDDIKIVFLQALAWARWGLEWDKEKGEWKDG